MRGGGGDGGDGGVDGDAVATRRGRPLPGHLDRRAEPVRRLVVRVLREGPELAPTGGALDERDLAAVALAGRVARGDSPFDVADQVTVLPEHARAWVGRPGVEGSRAGRD